MGKVMGFCIMMVASIPLLMAALMFWPILLIAGLAYAWFEDRR